MWYCSISDSVREDRHISGATPPPLRHSSSYRRTVNYNASLRNSPLQRLLMYQKRLQMTIIREGMLHFMHPADSETIRERSLLRFLGIFFLKNLSSFHSHVAAGITPTSSSGISGSARPGHRRRRSSFCRTASGRWKTRPEYAALSLPAVLLQDLARIGAIGKTSFGV